MLRRCLAIFDICAGAFAIPTSTSLQAGSQVFCRNRIFQGGHRPGECRLSRQVDLSERGLVTLEGEIDSLDLVCHRILRRWETDIGLFNS